MPHLLVSGLSVWRLIGGQEKHLVTAILEAIYPSVLAPRQKSANTDLKATAGDLGSSEIPARQAEARAQLLRIRRRRRFDWLDVAREPDITNHVPKASDFFTLL
jgi:hypothetical protein